MSHFCLTIRFLRHEYHGQRDGGDPEWPPSPLRVFQALVAASAARWNEREQLKHAVPALTWLEQRPAPLIVASPGQPAQMKYRLYVPDNVGDKVAASWLRGGSASIARYRTEKDVCPIRLSDDDGAVHYLWPVSDEDIAKHCDVLSAAARSITHIGWGVDMVSANTSLISENNTSELSGELWVPTDDSAALGFRVPMVGTLDALMAKHQAFLSRIQADGFHPVPPLSVFRTVGYQPANEPPAKPFAAFNILKPDASGFRPFDPVSKGIMLAGMMRHTASGIGQEVLGWPRDLIEGFICGHGESEGQAHQPVKGTRLAYIPLPSIEYRGADRADVAGSIRRSMLIVCGGPKQDELQLLARAMSGADLTEEKTGQDLAILSGIPNSDRMVRRYTKSSTTWSTVTPVILPGHDDRRKYRQRLYGRNGYTTVTSDEKKELLCRLDRRIDQLLRKAIRQAGYSDELADNARLEWRNSGFWPGTELANRYTAPRKLRRFRKLHVRITWCNTAGDPIEIPGPICLGGGRFVGLGLFAHSFVEHDR